MILVASLVGCSSLNSQESYPSIAEECELSESQDSPQCKIVSSKELTSAEQERLMGFIYSYTSEGVEKDCKKAKYWLEKSASQGNEEALDGLGTIYFVGCSVNKDYRKAEEYYLLANEKGSKQAKVNLGEIYREGGFGLERDYDKALYWYQLGLNDNPYRAYNSLASLYIDQENYEEAYKYLIQAADLGNPEAEYNLGVMYNSGIVVEENKEKAIYWYKKSAAQGWTDAQYNLDILLNEIAE